MKKFILLFLMFLVFIASSTVYAHSGCCSHHGGVSGCQCGDGTPLSTTCLPYYPECSGGGSIQNTQTTYTIPTDTPYIVVNTPTPKPTATPTQTPSPTITPTSTPIPTNTSVPPTFTPTPTIVAVKGSTSSGTGRVIILALLGGAGYWFFKRRKKNLKQ